MKKLLILASLAFGFAALSAPASARTYDCSKAGNANKAACKSAGAAKAASPKTTTATTTKAAARTYDCTKAGNKNKAACRTSTAQAAPAAAPAKTAKVAAPNYDCTKFINKMRAACRTAGASTPMGSSSTASPSAPIIKPATQARSTTGTKSVNSDSAGASAQCKDGSYSHAQHHSGACSRHGGVAKWM
jgi:hypothetical protein